MAGIIVGGEDADPIKLPKLEPELGEIATASRKRDNLLLAVQETLLAIRRGGRVVQGPVVLQYVQDTRRTLETERSVQFWLNWTDSPFASAEGICGWLSQRAAQSQDPAITGAVSACISAFLASGSDWQALETAWAIVSGGGP